MNRIVIYMLLVLVATCASAVAAQAQENVSGEGNARRFAHYDPRVQPVPDDPADAKAVEIEPLIRGLGLQLKAGTPAPDFELPVLGTKKNELGRTIGIVSADTVRLSSFRGKKAVALTLSGST